MPRICSNCHSHIPIPDDAKFCPSCGARAEVAAVAPPQGATTIMPTVVDATVTQLDTPRVIAGRFVVTGPATESPLGSILPTTDTQGGAPVRVMLVSTAALPSTALADRALREWKQLGKVATPKIVRVLDQGKLDDGKVYVASDVPVGRTLEEIVASDGPLGIERIKAIVTQVGEALTEAQKVGVIHRDVSPRNIHVDGDNVTVGEFGLAEAVNDKVFGTPAFLSPEQAEGKPVDQRSNIYSLGAVIYYMLTARPPFEGSPESLLAQHVSGTPAPPSGLRRAVPPELERIVMKALEKSGGRRHLTLRQLLTEVEGVPVGDAGAHAEELGSAATLLPPEPIEAILRAPAATIVGMSAVPAIDDMKTVEQEKLPERVVAETPVFVDAAPASAPTPRVDHGDVPVFVDQKPEAVAAVGSAKTLVEVANPFVAAAKVAAAENAAEDGKITAAVKAVEPAKTVEPVKVAEVARPPEPRSVEAVKPAEAKQPAAAKKGGFRETAWFKKGELDEAMAEAQANASDDPLAPTGTTGQHSAVDANSLSAQDERRLSLKTGATQMMPAIKVPPTGAQVVPGERMDEEEMLAEIDRGRRGLTIAAVIVGAVIVVTILAFAIRRGPTVEPAPGSPTAVSPGPTTAAPMPEALPPPPMPTTAPAAEAAPVPVQPPASTTPPPVASPPAKHGKKHK